MAVFVSQLARRPLRPLVRVRVRVRVRARVTIGQRGERESQVAVFAPSSSPLPSWPLSLIMITTEGTFLAAWITQL